MAIYDTKTVLLQIKKSELHSLYYFYGADIVQIEEITKKLIDKATDGNTELACTKKDGKNLNIRELEDDSQMFSMFAPYNCILINDFNAEQCKEDMLKKLFKVLESIGSSTIIIFNITGFDVKDGKKTASGKNKKLIDFVNKHGIVCEAIPKSEAEMVKALCSEAEKHGCILSYKNAGELVHRCMGNTLRLKSEIEKLCMCANGKEISLDIIESLVAPSIETTTFALAKAVVSLNANGAMKELDKLMALRIQRTIIVHSIASSFMDLYRAMTAVRNQKQQSDMKNDFGYNYDFMVRNAFRDCNKIAPERLRSCIIVLRDLEKQLNSTSGDERIMMETAIIKMLMIASGKYR